MNLTEQQIEDVENQIKNEQQSIDYDIRDFPIEYQVEKYLKGVESDKNEIYVPDYQREFIWDDNRQSKFIESIMLGLPIPLIFVAEIETSGRLEIVDGSQRIRTLAGFLSDDLILKNLQILQKLNGLKFSDLKASRQRIFKNTSMRMIVLSSKADEKVRNDMFGRINTSSVPLLPMETRRGVYKGKFTDFIIDLSKNNKFEKLCPIDKHFNGRREREELLLRFFAFADAHPTYNLNGINLRHTGVARFLDEYLKNKNQTVTEEELLKRKNAFYRVLDFIEKNFPKRGFRKFWNSNQTSRPYFEALSVGALLALRTDINASIDDISCFSLDRNNPNEFFTLLSGRYHTHTPKRLSSRIEYVKNQILQ